MTIRAQLQQAPDADRRISTRRKLSLGSSLPATGDEVTIHDVSSTGMLIETAADIVPFDGLEIDLPEVGITQAIVIWNSGRFYGCEFNERVSQAAVSAALLRSAPASPVDLSPAPAVPKPKRARAKAKPVADAEAFQAFDDEKAPLGVRLRVILGSAIVLWTLILLGIWSLVRLIQSNPG
jgi:hypothetical protein